MRTLQDAVEVLTAPHLHTAPSADGTPLIGMEEALLVQLDEAIGSTQGSRAGGSASKNTVPVDLGAVVLYEEIVRTLRYHAPQLSLSDLCDATRQWAAMDDEATVLPTLVAWEEQIREHLDPTPHRPLPGVSCPKCLNSALPRIMDGETVMVPVITIYPRQLIAECTVCEERWEGQRALISLAENSAGM